jgi:exosortase/archaeosortase family protein
MKTISAEDKLGIELASYRVYGTLLIAISFLIGTLGSMLVTGFSLIDSDPTSYVIAVLMMGVLFIVFTLKDKRELRPDINGVILGVMIFAIYVIALAFLRVSLSWIFMTYRIDALLLPLLLASLVMIVFGTDGIKIFWPVIVYVAFASPILLLPVLGLNASLAGISSRIVYFIIKALGVKASLAGLAITAPNGSIVTIAETCVPIGIFIALLMFLVPVAYLYNGDLSRKTIWIASGMVLLFALNIARMSIISFAWAYYGIEGAISGFHSIAGGIIFYATIAVMLLLCNRYGMSLIQNVRAKKAKALRKAKQPEINHGITALCIILGVGALLLSAPYLSSVTANLLGFGSAHMPTTAWIESMLGGGGANVIYLGNFSKNMFFGVGNASVTTYALVNLNNEPDAGFNMLNFSVVGRGAEIYGDGITVHSVSAISNDSRFGIAYFSMPYNSGNYSETVNIELFSKSSGQIRCAQKLDSIGSFVNEFETVTYDTLSRGQANIGGICDISLPN